MDAMTWLTAERGLDAALLAEMGVRAQEIDGYGQGVAFPYRRDGETYAGKFRTVSDKRWRSTNGVSRGFYNEDCLEGAEGPIVITEGEIDCLSVIQAGYERAVSLPDGWTEAGNKRDVLVNAEERLRASPYVIVAGDNDAAGASLPRTVANVLLGHDVRRAEWPEGCKDANDVLVRLGERVLARCLADAKRVDPPGGFVTAISDLRCMAPRRVLRTGKRVFDSVLAFEVGAMSVATGVPGCGKSTFTTFIADLVSRHEDVRVGLLSFETHPYRTRDHLSRLDTGWGWDDLAADEQRALAVRLDDRFRIVHRTYEEGAHNLGWLKSMVYTLAVRDGCKLIVVDPWNELEHLPEPGESMTAYINFALQQIRVWAEQFDTHVCVVAHPRKMPTDGRPRAPVGYDISDSAAFANKPALGVTVHQDETDDGRPFVRVITWKVRDTQLYGFEKGQIKLEFRRDQMSYAALP
ncbi:toprim domain-containing protein [Defluviimonas sp. WL0024]|uniref:Toprim domain-containing protein n=2 Tax=Albidovulum salinarum TaxID=2984153 RepID=A0ABT2X4R8_9RHOB|nr:toprim domain-containing protein [Defluviimonas sp. WL0024]